MLLTLFIVQNLIHSRTGRAIMAIRDNRIAAESVESILQSISFWLSPYLRLWREWQGSALCLASNLATLAATPKAFGYNMSIMILVFVVLGGIGNIRGSIIAAVILTLLPELLRGLSSYRMLIYAIVLIVMMLLNSSPKAIEIRSRIIESIRGRKKKEQAKEA